MAWATIQIQPTRPSGAERRADPCGGGARGRQVRRHRAHVADEDEGERQGDRAAAPPGRPPVAAGWLGRAQRVRGDRGGQGQGERSRRPMAPAEGGRGRRDPGSSARITPGAAVGAPDRRTAATAPRTIEPDDDRQDRHRCIAGRPSRRGTGTGDGATRGTARPGRRRRSRSAPPSMARRSATGSLSVSRRRDGERPRVPIDIAILGGRASTPLVASRGRAGSDGVDGHRVSFAGSTPSAPRCPAASSPSETAASGSMASVNVPDDLCRRPSTVNCRQGSAFELGVTQDEGRARAGGTSRRRARGTSHAEDPVVRHHDPSLQRTLRSRDEQIEYRAPRPTQYRAGACNIGPEEIAASSLGVSDLAACARRGPRRPRCPDWTRTLVFPRCGRTRQPRAGSPEVLRRLRDGRGPQLAGSEAMSRSRLRRPRGGPPDRPDHGRVLRAIAAVVTLAFVVR